jgi:drug/metabolite transporter (DMT)-like permease
VVLGEKLTVAQMLGMVMIAGASILALRSGGDDALEPG